MMPPARPPDPCSHCQLPGGWCRGCHAKILWARSTEGKPEPLDYTTTTVAVPVSALTKYTLENVVPQEIVGHVKGHVPHHITCPEAARFRGDRTSKPSSTG